MIDVLCKSVAAYLSVQNHQLYLFFLKIVNPTPFLYAKYLSLVGKKRKPEAYWSLHHLFEILSWVTHSLQMPISHNRVHVVAKKFLIPFSHVSNNVHPWSAHNPNIMIMIVGIFLNIHLSCTSRIATKAYCENKCDMNFLTRWCIMWAYKIITIK